MLKPAKIVAERPVAVADIHVSEDRLRPVSETAVESIMASVSEIGMFLQPIILRKVTGAHARLELIAGAHRVEVAKRLELKEIPARIVSCSADQARHIECDENLETADLDALELAVFLHEKKVVYERLFPQAKQGGDRRSKAYRNQNDTMSFCSVIAEKRGISRKQVERLVAAGRKIERHHRPLLFAMEKRPTLKDLTEIGTIAYPEIRNEVVELFATGKASSAKEAINIVTGGKPNLSPEQIAEQRLADAWARTSRKLKRRFIEHNWDEIIELKNQAQRGVK